MPKKARPDLLARLGPRPSEVASPRRSLRLQGLSLADDDAQVAWLEREFSGMGVGGRAFLEIGSLCSGMISPGPGIMKACLLHGHGLSIPWLHRTLGSGNFTFSLA